MSPTDEELLHAFYAGDDAALERLAERHDWVLSRIAFLILVKRTQSETQASQEFDLDDRTASVWTHVAMTRLAAIGSWPHQRLSALTWFIHLLCLEMDQHLGTIRHTDSGRCRWRSTSEHRPQNEPR